MRMKQCKKITREAETLAIDRGELVIKLQRTDEMTTKLRAHTGIN